MKIRLIGRGHAVETAPETWAGGAAAVSVRCSHASPNGWGEGCEAVLESSENRSGNVLPWAPVATFDRDSERTVPMPAGLYRWRVSQAADDVRALRFSLDVGPRQRREKVPSSTVHRKEVEEIAGRVSALEGRVDAVGL